MLHLCYYEYVLLFDKELWVVMPYVSTTLSMSTNSDYFTIDQPCDLA